MNDNPIPGKRPAAAVRHLTCEYIDDPVGIDRLHPLLGWQIHSGQRGTRQSAYRVLVAGSPDKLDKNEADIWDSGKIASSRSQHLRYAGPALQSGKVYYWKVKIWDQDGDPSGWSEMAHWSMGLLDKDDWRGKWISTKFKEVSAERTFFSTYGQQGPLDQSDTPAVYMRKSFRLDKQVKRAVAYISGLGYYELYANGEKIGGRVLDPVFTDYQRRVKYATYDITAQLKKGENALGVILGNGFYNSPTEDLFQMDRANWKTPPKLLLDLHIDFYDGEKLIVSSDKSWKWSYGEIVYNSIRGGETIDHRERQEGWNQPHFDAAGWKQVVPVPAPAGKLGTQYLPPLRVNERIPPVRVFEAEKGVYIADFGKNITGWVSLKVKGARGQVVECWHNELLNPDSSLNIGHSSGHTRGRFQKAVFILDGKGEEIFEPRFTYHGFRYVQIKGLREKPGLEDIVAKSVHTDLDTAGYFACSSERLNQLQAAVQRTLLNSIHGMPGEEPTREKMGWTFDAGMVTMESYLYNFDAVNVYKKTLQDLIDAQGPFGNIPSIVPTNGWSTLTPEGKPFEYNDPWWGGTIFFVAGTLFDHTADTAILKKAFGPMKSYVDFVASTAEDDLVYWSLGDWLDMKFNGKPGLTPVVQTSSQAYYWMNQQLAKFARLLNEKELAVEYAAKAERIAKKINDAFLDKSTGWYSQGSQTAQALPLYLGMVPGEMLPLVTDCLLAAIDSNDQHVNAGFVGIIPLLNYLSANGYMEEAFRMVNQEESPGWLYMVRDEMSTLGENLNGAGYGSGHHPFGACIGSWFFKYLGGIRPDTAYAGFQQFIIAPQIVKELSWVKSATHSIYGEISSSWEKTRDSIHISFSVPGNTSATVLLPVSSPELVRAAGKTIEETPGLQLLDAGEKTIRLTAGSGSYNLSLPLADER